MSDDGAVTPAATNWRLNGIKRISSNDKSADTPETKGLGRMVAISGSRTGSPASRPERT